MPAPKLQFITPNTTELLQATRLIFQEYAAQLGIDLGFQDFYSELAGLPGDYSAPNGALLLDTLSDMESARALYADLGFEEIPPYYRNPIAGAHYLKVDL